MADRLSKKSLPSDKRGLTGALLFFEASTRTRMSFETACVRLGIHPLLLEGVAGTSLEKGETLEDTVLNVAAMKPEFLIIRCGEELDLEKMCRQVNMPVINAGWGKKGHPTQALLDAYTIRRHLGSLAGQKVLIVGDVKHSRVAASHFELAQKLDYELAICGPRHFLPEKSSVKIFEDLQEGLRWATVAMALRVQLERHEEKFSLQSYRDQFGFTRDNLRALSNKALIMHPGPINQGTELDTETLADPRSVILDQVHNGVLLRQAILHQLTNEGEL